MLHVVHTAAVEEQTEADEGGGSTDGGQEQRAAAAAFGGSGFEAKSHAHSHDPHEPREHEVGDCEAVPGAVIEKPVAAAAVVDEYHDHQTHASEGVERKQAGAALGARLALCPTEGFVEEVDCIAAGEDDEEHDEYRGVGGVGRDEVDEENFGGAVGDVVEGGDVDAAGFDVQSDLRKVLQFFTWGRKIWFTMSLIGGRLFRETGSER